MMLALRLTNNTGSTLTEFTLGYTGEQWFESVTEQNNQYVVSYQIGTIADISSGSWTEIEALEFNTPKETGADDTLIGSDAENQVVLSAETVASIVWEDGEDLWIRWFDSNSSGFDQGIAIDDVSFSAIPEPSHYAILLGMGALGLTACRRRM
ncbi:PEP-CTERM sorting domain-containing protein [Coraliomargarita algicola]|uniref:PEP-CTERM sorting domain-containing protein n=1 Tax=Coraliomargarita algicola TaxID=3092156 RepID=A0ABZ0RG97_9BACT|nr:PEP-CTERM sorting domain-containing protein [Coraliomargarita sp. J2-16]WPJ94045.1 PEP-CTERM sorting domain-containing protein [Coraliomargarita sp. J2-16]